MRGVWLRSSRRGRPWRAALLGSLGAVMVALVLSLIPVAPGAAQKPLPTVAPGAWVEVPGSRLDSVLWRDASGRTLTQLKGSGGPENIVNAWNGAAWDEERELLIVPAAGGDGDYAGNEVYVFSLREGTWRRETDPSVEVIPSNHDTKSTPPCVYKGERGAFPCSRHTYNGAVYMPSENRVWLGGGSRWWGGAGIVDTFLWNLETKQWEHQPSDPTQSYDLGYIAVWDDKRSRVVYLDFSRLRSWTPGAAPGRRVRIIDDGSLPNDSANRFYTGLYDPKRQRMVIAGPKGLAYFELGSRDGGVKRRPLAVTGGTWPEVYAPGFVYDSVNDRYAVYGGGKWVAFVEPETGRLTIETGSGPATPGTPNGTFGRFRFSRSQGVFVLVNRIDENVRLYRPRSANPS